MQYAHSRAGEDKQTWQELATHLANVGELAAAFAPPQLASLARTAGRWHDVGKYQAAFQRYIGADPELSNENSDFIGQRVPHAAAGAALALEVMDMQEAGSALALVIAAHHGSLQPVRDVHQIRAAGTPLLSASRRGGLPESLERECPSREAQLSALAIRMIFSALVDADLLDTEAWDLGRQRSDPTAPLATLRDRAKCPGSSLPTRAARIETRSTRLALETLRVAAHKGSAD